MLKFSCDQCGASFGGDVKQIGRRFKCPKCGREFRIQPAGSPPAGGAVKPAPAPARTSAEAAPRARADAPRPRRPVVQETSTQQDAPSSNHGKRIAIGAAAGLGVLAAVVTFMVMGGGGENPQTPQTSVTSDPSHAAVPAVPDPSDPPPPKQVEWRIPPSAEPIVRESANLAMQALGPVQRPIHPDTAIALAMLHARLGNKDAVRQILEAGEEPKNPDPSIIRDSPEPYGVRAARVAAEAQDSALTMQMFDRALEEAKILGEYPTVQGTMSRFAYLLHAQLELGDLAGAKVTVDAWRRMPEQFPHQAGSSASGPILLAGMLNDFKEIDALMAAAPKTEGRITIESWVLQRLIEARRFDAALFLITDPRTTNWIAQFDPSALVSAVLATGDVEAAIRVAEALAPGAEVLERNAILMGWDQILAALAEKGELDRALRYARELTPMEKAFASATIAPYFARAGRLDAIRDLVGDPRENLVHHNLLSAVLAKLDGQDARYNELMNTLNGVNASSVSPKMYERLAGIQLGVGDVEGAGLMLAKSPIWRNRLSTAVGIPITARRALSAFARAGQFDSFIGYVALRGNPNDRQSERYRAMAWLLPAMAAKGGSAQALTMSGSFIELVPAIVAAQAGAGDVNGARAAIASIDQHKDTYSITKPMIRAKAHAQIGLALLPGPRPPVSMAGARPGMPTLDLPTSGLARIALPARPDLASIIGAAQQHIHAGAADNAALLAHLARLQIELGDKDGAGQSLARAQQTAAIVPDAATRIDGFFQIALARIAAGDVDGGRSALISCMDATALLDSRYTRMDAMLALQDRLQSLNQSAWTVLVADAAAQVAGDLNDQKLQTQLARMRLRTGNLDATATLMNRHRLSTLIYDDELTKRLVDTKDVAGIKQFLEASGQKAWASKFWMAIVTAMIQKNNLAGAKEAFAHVTRLSVLDQSRLWTLLGDAGEDDIVLAAYDKALAEAEVATPKNPPGGHGLALAQRRAPLDRAAARTLARKGRARQVQAFYTAIPGIESIYSRVLERLAPAVFKAADNVLYAELLGDYKAHADKIPPSLKLQKLNSLILLAQEQFEAGDKVGGNASVDALLATPSAPAILGRSLEALLATAGRSDEAIKLTGTATKVAAAPANDFDKLMAAGQYADAQRLALQANDRSRYIEAVAMQAKAGDIEGATKAVVALSPIAWRGHIPYAMIAIGQGLVARDRQGSIESIKAPAKIAFLADLPAIVAKPGQSLAINPTRSAPNTIYLNKDDPATVEGWIAMLDDPNENRRGMGIKLLQNAGAKSFPAIRRLGQIAQSDPAGVIRDAAEKAANSIFEATMTVWMSSRESLPEPAHEVGTRLGEFLVDRTVRRPLRLKTLDRINPWSTNVSSGILPATAMTLCGALDDIDDGERFALTVGAWATSKDADPAALKVALAHQNPAIRAAAMHAMLKGHDQYRPSGVVSALDRHRMLLLTSPFVDVREAGLVGIEAISPQMLPVMVAMMKTTDINARAKVAVKIAITPHKPPPEDFKTQNAEAAAILVEATKDTDFATRKAATMVARALELVPTPPAPRPQPDPAPRSIPKDARDGFKGRAGPVRPGPRAPATAPDEVVIGRTNLALTEAVTPALIAQVLGRKDQSIETKRMFASAFRADFRSQRVTDAILPYLPGLIAENDHEICVTLGAAIQREQLPPNTPPRHREALIKAFKDAIRSTPILQGIAAVNDPRVWAVNKLQSPPDDDRFRFNTPTFKNNNEARTVLRKGDAGPTQMSHAMQHLRNAKANDGDTMNALIAVLDHGNNHVRGMAAGHLAEIGRPAAPALNSLMKQFKEEVDSQTRASFVRAIFAIGPDSPVAEQVSLELLGIPHGPGPEFYQLIAASKNLRLLEVDVEARWRETVERLAKRHQFDERQSFPRSGLFHSFSSMPPEELKKMRVPQVILDALKSPRIDTRAQALDTLNHLKYAADSAAPNVVALLNDEERDIQDAAIFALERMERGEDLAAIMSSQDEQHAAHALNALGRLGPKAAAILPMLEEKLKTPNLPHEEKTKIEFVISRIKESPRNPRQPPRSVPR